MARDGRRPGASPSWLCGIWGWGRGALRTEFKRKHTALWRSWEKPMVGESIIYNSDFNGLLSSPVTPLQTFQEWPHCSYGSWLPDLPSKWEAVKKREQRELLRSHADCLVYTHGCAHSVGLKTTYHTFSESCFRIRNTNEYFWIISWKSEKTIFFSWHKYGWSISEHFSREYLLTRQGGNDLLIPSWSVKLVSCTFP